MSRKHNLEWQQDTRIGVLDMYDNIAYLYSQGERTYDTWGNEEISYTRKTVYVQPRGVYNSEFYNASQIGLHPSITLEMTNRADYSGEKIVEFDNRLYDVIRTDWDAQRDKISLVLQERINVEAD